MAAGLVLLRLGAGAVTVGLGAVIEKGGAAGFDCIGASGFSTGWLETFGFVSNDDGVEKRAGLFVSAGLVMG